MRLNIRLFLLAALCGASAANSTGRAAQSPVDKNVELGQALSDASNSWANVSLFCDMREWVLSGSSADLKAEKVATIAESAVSDSAPSDTTGAESKAGAFADSTESILGQSAIEKWEVLCSKTKRKFRMTYDPDTLKRLNVKHVVIQVPREWLYTDKTLYDYIEPKKVLRVRPIDPFSDAYPFRLDIASFIFSLTVSPNEFMKMESLSVKRDGEIALTSTAGNLKISGAFIDGGVSISKVEMKLNEANSFRRYFLHQAHVDDGGPFMVPFTVIDIHKLSNGSVRVQLFSFTAVKFGVISEDDLALKVDPSAHISDETQPFPIKKTQ
jgi:hypothetical protein